MKQFDVSNIEKRAQRLLEEHMNMLEPKLGTFEKQGVAYLQEWDSDDSFLKIGYATKNKFLTRSYNLEFKLVLAEIDLPEDFKARIRFTGFREIEAALFHAAPKNERVDKIINRPELISLVVDTARAVDIGDLRMEYVSRNSTLNVSLVPYAGAYIWVKFPPAFYPLRLHEPEMNALLKLAQGIRYVSRKAWGFENHETD